MNISSAHVEVARFLEEQGKRAIPHGLAAFALRYSSANSPPKRKKFYKNLSGITSCSIPIH
jgi:hypothetical protein